MVVELFPFVAETNGPKALVIVELNERLELELQDRGRGEVQLFVCLLVCKRKVKLVRQQIGKLPWSHKRGNTMRFWVDEGGGHENWVYSTVIEKNPLQWNSHSLDLQQSDPSIRSGDSCVWKKVLCRPPPIATDSLEQTHTQTHIKGHYRKPNGGIVFCCSNGAAAADKVSISMHLVANWAALRFEAAIRSVDDSRHSTQKLASWPNSRPWTKYSALIDIKESELSLEISILYLFAYSASGLLMPFGLPAKQMEIGFL